MKKTLSVVLGLCCLLLTSCVPIQTNIEALMEPPKLSDRQYQVNEALKDGVGQGFKLKYPQSGDYRSAFTFYDLDGNGKEEAIVFYAPNTTASFLRVTVLYEENGRWRSGPDLQGLGAEVDFLRIEQLKEDEPKSLVVGWTQESSAGKKIAAVYNYADGDLVMDYTGDYSRIAIDDFHNDGTSEIVLITSYSMYGSSTASLIGEIEPGMIDLMDEVELPPMISSYFEPLCGKISSSGTGVVVDGYTEGRTLATTVIRVEDDHTLSLPMSENDYLLFTRSTRKSEVFSQDVNSDGIIEIPLQYPAPGHDQMDEEDEACYITNYSQLSGTGFTTVSRAFVSSNENYRLTFPQSWMEADITVYRQPEDGEMIFYLYNGKDVYDRTQELCRIRVTSTQDYQDKLAAELYFSLGQRGTIEYLARIPTNAPEPLRINSKQLKDLFSFIN
ncbi:MAG: hypothetical protein VB100_02560 [Angelakisella sp.]|nr:hypothetical protein [Angelakisella sp.]